MEMEEMDMTFLAKLGGFLAKGIALLSGLGPLLTPLFGSKSGAVVGTVVQDLTSIGSVVVSAEAMLGAGTGPAKLAAAAPLVANIVKTSELVSGHKIANEALFIQGCTDITNAVAEILNSLDGGAVQSTGQPIPTVPAPTVAAVPAALKS
jgi:hypothetical protein